MKKLTYKFFFGLIMSLLISSNIYGAQKVQTITLIGDDAYPPYSYLSNKAPAGVYVDVIRMIFSKIPEYDVKIKLYPWKRDVNMIKFGKAMGFFPPYFIKNRTSWITYSEPILGETVVVYARDKDILSKKNWPEDFYGLSVCLNDGFSLEGLGGKKFKKAVGEKKIKLNRGRSNEACLKQVQKKSSDLYINEKLISLPAFYSVKRGIAVKVNQGYLGFTKKTDNFPNADDVRVKFNNILLKMQKNGEIDKIIQKYLE
jgi:polar amino acid transport system substrate-binding protein